MKKAAWILAALMVIKFLLQYAVIAPIYELHRDEYLHLDQGRHLDWGYVSVPPLTSLFSWIIFRLGGSEFWVKFFPALFGALTMLFTWKIVRELKGGPFAASLATIAVLVSAILRLNTLFQPNSFDVLIWTVVYYLLICYVNRKQGSYLLWAGVAIGIGMLNKYNVAFLVIGLAISLMMVPERRLLWKGATWIAAALTLLVMIPNIIWQYVHDFPVVGHMKELADTQLVNVSAGDFLKEQVLYFLGSCWLFVFAAIGFVRNPSLRPYRWVGLSFLVIIALFLYLHAKGYYAIGLYPVLLAVGAVQFEEFASGRYTRYLRPASLLLILGLFIPFLKIAFPLNSPETIANNPDRYRNLGQLRWEDGKDHLLPQDFADMIGWKEMASKVDSSYAALKDKGFTLVLTDNYGQAGAINYYSKHRDIHAVSMNADYINWIPYDTDIRNVILVQESSDDDPGRQRERKLFRTVTNGGVVTNPFARETGTRIYSCIDALQPIGPILKAEAKGRLH